MGLYRRKDSSVWWMSLTVSGKQIRESTETSDKAVAKIRLAERLTGKETPAKGTVGTLLDGLILDYEINDYDLRFAHQWVDNHLRPWFGDMQIASVTKSAIREFQAAKTKKLSNASVNRCVALLKRSFNIAEIPFPKIEMLKEDNIRRGFIEPENFWAIYENLPEHAKPVILLCYETGTRINEALNIRWNQLDFMHGLIRLDETKNDDSRTIPISKMMAFMLKRLQRINEFVFTYQGRHLRSIRTGWQKTCKELGEKYEHLLVHDLRRSAIRNMVRSGVSEKIAMRISGHRSRSVFDRYNVCDENDLKDAIHKVEQERPSFATNAPEIQEFFEQADKPQPIAIAKIDPKVWGNRPKHGKVIVVPENPTPDK